MVTSPSTEYTLRSGGETKAEEEKKDAHWHMRERRVSSFAIHQPGHSDPVRRGDAQFDHGVLTLTLPKTVLAKPKQIKVVSGPTPPPSSDRPDRPAQEPATSVTGKTSPAPQPPKPGGKPEPTQDLAAEQARESNETATARKEAAASR